MSNQSGDEDDLAEWFSRPVDDRVIDLLGHVMMSLRDLPVFACDRSVLNRGSIWFPAYLACVEAFFVNARLAAEFFVRMPNRDFNAKMFVPEWTPPPAVAKRLERVWSMTSTHIVHFGRDRVPDQPDSWEQEDTSYRALMRINRDAHSVFGRLVDAADQLGSPHADRLRDMHHGTRPQSAKELAALHGPARRAARLNERHVFQDPYASVWWTR